MRRSKNRNLISLQDSYAFTKQGYEFKRYHFSLLSRGYRLNKINTIKEGGIEFTDRDDFEYPIKNFKKIKYFPE